MKYIQTSCYLHKQCVAASLPAFVGVLQLNTLDSPRGIPRNHSLRVPVEQSETTEVNYFQKTRQTLYANTA